MIRKLFTISSQSLKNYLITDKNISTRILIFRENKSFINETDILNTILFRNKKYCEKLKYDEKYEKNIKEMKRNKYSFRYS
tara:strand:- start:7867 stop:8109 length:243 start_codon:yes stop_codon:yes gene_type:complete